MMIKGVTEKEEKIIKDILREYPYDFYYYGSRVKGDFTKASDLDILTNELSYSELEKIETKFNESRIPYVVNLSLKSNMDEKFYNLIKKDLVKIEI